MNKRKNSLRNKAGNRLGIVPTGVSQELCLQPGETQYKKRKGLKKKRQHIAWINSKNKHVV